MTCVSFQCCLAILDSCLRNDEVAEREGQVHFLYLLFFNFHNDMARADQAQAKWFCTKSCYLAWIILHSRVSRTGKSCP